MSITLSGCYEICSDKPMYSEEGNCHGNSLQFKNSLSSAVVDLTTLTVDDVLFKAHIGHSSTSNSFNLSSDIAVSTIPGVIQFISLPSNPNQLVIEKTYTVTNAGPNNIVREVKITTSENIIFSYTNLRDSSGNPTSIAIASGDSLTIKYSLTVDYSFPASSMPFFYLLDHIADYIEETVDLSLRPPLNCDGDIVFKMHALAVTDAPARMIAGTSFDDKINFALFIANILSSDNNSFKGYFLVNGEKINSTVTDNYCFFDCSNVQWTSGQEHQILQNLDPVFIPKIKTVILGYRSLDKSKVYPMGVAEFNITESGITNGPGLVMEPINILYEAIDT